MAKSDLSDIMGYISNLVENMTSGDDMKVFSQELFEKLEDLFGGITVKDLHNLTEKEQSKYFKALIDTLKASGMITKDSLTALRAFQGLLKEKKVDSDKLVAGLTNFIASMEAMSEKFRQGGGGREFLKATDDKFSKDVSTYTAKAMGLELNKSLDSTSKKLFNFFGETFLKTIKAVKQVGSDLIEGLANSKFIGGALKDIFSLVGLMGGRWLSQFGTFGKVLGVVFYGAMSSFGPVLSKIILEATLKGTGKLISFLGGQFLKGIIGLSTKIGGPLSMFAPGRWGMMTNAGKALSVGRLAGSLGVATAAFVGAGFAAKEGADSWKKGRKGNAVALGGGALALAGGGIAAIIAGAFAPITLTLLGIGAVVTGIGWAWKHHSETIKKWGKKAGEFLGKAFEFMAMFNPIFAAIKWIKDHWPFGGKDGESKGGGTPWFGGKRVEGSSTDLTPVERIDNMSLNKAGAVLDVSKMDKMTASRVAEQYMKQRPTEFGRTYEAVGSKYASLGDFQNDWAIRNAQGQATQAVLYKGASQNLENMWTALVSTGAMTKERAQLLKYTSGRSTATSPHSGKGTGKANSHDNILNLVTDLAAADWSDDEWEAAMKVLKPMLYDAGFDLKWEGVNKSGKTIFGDQFVRGLSNRHFHVGIRKGFENMIPEELQQNVDEYGKRQEATTISDNIAISNVLKSLPEDERKRIADKIQKQKLTGKSPNEFAENAEKVLKEEGIYRSDSLKGRPWFKKGENGQDQFLMDASGNRTYSKMQQTISNFVNIGTENTAYC